jgi:aminoglycoside phosphotransferase (APT) family kinase protein
MNLIPVLPNHRFDETRLMQYLRQRLPDFGTECVIRQFQGGQSNPTFHLATATAAYVLRKKPPGVLLPSAHAVDREFRIMSALQDSDVPVPRMLLLCSDESVIGQVFYVMEYIEGRLFTDVSLPELPDFQRAAIHDSMNTILANLHRVDVGTVGLSDYGRPEGFIPRQITRWSRQYAAAGLDDCPAMDRLMTWLNAQDPVPDEVTIVHGDYRLGNLLIHPTEPRIVAVLDWELSTLGHPLADLSYTCLPYHAAPMGPGGVPFAERGIAGIPSEAEFVDAYCHRVGRAPIARWPFFIAFSLFRAAAILAGVYKRALNGNACDARALEHGAVYRQLAETGWRIAQNAA